VTALHLARAEDAGRVLPLVAAFHAEMGIDSDETTRAAGIAPLLDGSPHGVVYLMGPQRAPIGYVVISFGWSVEFGGMDGFVDEIFVRPGVRGRGIGAEVLSQLAKALGEAGMKALHLEVRKDDARTRRFYEKLRFAPRDDYTLMTRK
jgi:ribosomal protein S18 acetylase RimI-like enzyme